MDDFSPSDLKCVLHSKRANIYYLEHWNSWPAAKRWIS